MIVQVTNHVIGVMPPGWPSGRARRQPGKYLWKTRSEGPARPPGPFVRPGETRAIRR
ncbi:hypothetical protein GCM10009780_36580 [Actinomadura alba]